MWQAYQFLKCKLSSAQIIIDIVVMLLSMIALASSGYSACTRNLSDGTMKQIVYDVTELTTYFCLAVITNCRALTAMTYLSARIASPQGQMLSSSSFICHSIIWHNIVQIVSSILKQPIKITDPRITKRHEQHNTRLFAHVRCKIQDNENRLLSSIVNQLSINKIYILEVSTK
jgi:hypothetical protein